MSELEATALDLAQRQALEYGKDLARLFSLEQGKRHEIEALNHMLETVLESIPQGLVVTDAAFVIERGNPAFRRLFPGTSEIRGQLLAELVENAAFSALVTRLGTSEGGTVEFFLKDQEYRALTATFAALHGASTRQWVILFQDQTHARRLERQKTDFVNLLANELRAPLASVVEYAEGMATNPEDQQQRAALLREGAQRLEHLIVELLRFSELAQSDYTPDAFVEIDLETYIRNLLSTFHALADDKLVITQLFAPEPIRPIQTNPALLTTALTQLILNALDGMSAGGVMRLDVLPDDTDVIIRVSDSGSQIPLEERETIFALSPHRGPFEAGDKLRIGLPIAKRAVDRLGGDLILEKSGTAGTTFQIRLPYEVANAAALNAHLQEQLDARHRQSMLYANDLKQVYKKLQVVNSELRATNTQLEEANRLKSNFLGLVSHELKTPIASLETALHLFKRMGTDNLTADQQVLLAQITQNHAQTRTLIDQLVKHAALVSKQGTLTLAATDLVSVMAGVMRASEPIALSRGLNLSLESTESKIIVQCDAKLIEEAVWQLVQNAIKATPAGGSIIVRAASDYDNVTVQVHDTGRGIARDKQEAIWHEFTQTSDFLQRGVDGLGLGLALVRYVATAHHGQVTLQSEIGIGSVVGFWLPRTPPGPE